MRMNFRITLVAATVAFALMLFAPCAKGAVLSLDPLTQAVDLGTPVMVDLVASGLGNGAAPALGGYTGLQIEFNPGILQPKLVTFSNRLGDPSDPMQVIFAVNTFFTGMVLLDQVSMLDPTTLYGLQASPTGSFVIATLTFDTIGVGTSSLTISPGVLSDEMGNPIDPTVSGARVTVGGSDNPGIPEPSTWLLAAAGACALVAKRLF